MPKHNPDYSKTAVNLTNPNELAYLLGKMHEFEKQKQLIQDNIKNRCPDLISALEYCDETLKGLRIEIEEAIEVHGSYQDVEKGEYALKYKKVTLIYNAEAFKSRYPKLAPVVLEEVINENILKGLVKSGLLEMKELLNGGLATPVITEKESFAFIIK